VALVQKLDDAFDAWIIAFGLSRRRWLPQSMPACIDWSIDQSITATATMQAL